MSPADVLARARSGDIPGAIAAGEALLTGGLRDPGLSMFVGMLCGRNGDLSRGIPHLRRAVELAPREIAAKVELARALMATGAHAESESVAAPLASLATPAGREMQRILGHARFRGGAAPDAAQLFEALVAADSADFESWGGLGAARLAADDIAGAVTALEQATALRPPATEAWVNLARAHAAAGDFEAAAAAAAQATARAPADAAAQLELGRALAGTGDHDEALAALEAAAVGVGDNAELLVEIGDIEFTCKAPERAETRFRSALALAPGLLGARLGLGRALERLNRTAELRDLLAELAADGVDGDATALLHAVVLRNEGSLEAALATARAAPSIIDPVGRAQLIGDIADRLGRPDEAFAAFTEANDRLSADQAGSLTAAAAYLESFERIRDLLTPAWHAGWSPPAPPGPRRAPLFIFGFPRSGTTLIDTMLSGHPDAVVLEETVAIDRVAEALGPVNRLALLGADEIVALRARYFAEVDRLAPDAADRLIVDKHPLALGNAPLLHRLFPDARFVFVERHPCDVVLSCFITSSRMSANVASFFSFTGTARLYDRVLAFWTRAVEVLPLAVHTMRYETLIGDPEAELRQLAAFAGLAWDARLLANQDNASARRYIGSPSYAQVAEPIYTRARGRWLRYREHMAAVLPILAPWAERLKYEI